MRLPLEGLRVLDLCRLIPGGLLTRKLADLGADVVKVEDPGLGDYLRAIPPIVDGVGLMHTLLNRNKRSIALDLKTPEGREQLRRLSATADVLVEVSRPGKFKKAGLDINELRSQNPRLVVCSVSAYGQAGPYAQLPAHGMNIDALASILPTHTHPNDTERRVIADGLFSSVAAELAGATGALNVLAAVMEARECGQGASLDVSCWDVGTEANRVAIAFAAAKGSAIPSVSDMGPLYDLYESSDGTWLLFAPIEQKFWVAFCEGVDRPDLITRWDSDGAAVDFGGDDTLRDELTDVFRRESGEVWQQRFVDWGVPGSLVRDVDGLLADPHFAARRLLDPPLAAGQSVPNVLDGVRWMNGDGDWRRGGEGGCPAPGLGDHSEEVVRSWLVEEPSRSA